MHRRTLLKNLGASTALLAARPYGFAAPQQPLSILFNQVGFLPGASKMLAVRPKGRLASPHFRVLAEDGSVCLEGELGAPAKDLNSGDVLCRAVLSPLRTSGVYRVSIDGSVSDPFRVDPTIYAQPLRTAIRAFYGQRCGCTVDLGGGYRHPACHLSGAYHSTSGRSGPVPNHGGWHDAGDYGRYAVNCGISTATLLWAWELYQPALQTLSLAIPESGGHLPDFLAEIQWNLNWMLSLQDTDGGVWHKQTSEHFCAFIMPQDDQLTSYIIGTGQPPYKSTCATADLAAVAAIAARCYRPYAPAYADRCLEAARGAWRWAMAHPGVVFRNPPGISTGEYGDAHCSDELLWASAELWRTTGEAQYQDAFLNGFRALPPSFVLAAPSWGSVAPLACWTYALAAERGGRRGDAAVLTSVRQQTRQAAAKLIAQAEASGYGATLAAEDYRWGSNSTAANQSLLLLLADHFDRDQRAVDAAFGNLDYLLGRNCFGVSWVTQVGTRPFQHPHHRPSVADGITAPWPGLLSGGPNAIPGDPVAKTLPSAPPMRMWVDDWRAYSMNEIAINWNAPLVFLLAAANSTRS